MKIFYRPEVKIDNPYKNRIYTCSCGIKFQVEDSDIKNVIEQPITKCFSSWYEYNIPRYWKLHFIRCECGRTVALTKLAGGTGSYFPWHIDFDGEEIKDEGDEQ